VGELPQIKSLEAADTSRAVPLGRIDLVELGGMAFDRATFEPGWRWSEHDASAGEGQLCAQRHLGYLVSGRMRFRMEDGVEVEAEAGNVYLIPPGHDAWVVGDQPCVALDLGPA
jgi:quercetin dioxygenase-like cupin family protein